MSSRRGGTASVSHHDESVSSLISYLNYGVEPDGSSNVPRYACKRTRDEITIANSRSSDDDSFSAKHKSAKKVRTGAPDFSPVVLDDVPRISEAGPSSELSNARWAPKVEARESQLPSLGQTNYEVANNLVKDAVHENHALRRELSSLTSQNERDTLMWKEQ